MKSFDVVTIGAATQDVFVRSKKLEEQKDPLAPDGVDACIPLGSKLSIDELSFASGGGATNAAATFAHLGLKTACLSRIGDDLVGDFILAELKRERIDTSLVVRAKQEMSAYSVILLAGSGHRGILTHRGASAGLDTRDLPRKLKTRWIYATSLGGNKRLLKAAFDLADACGAKIAWNPGNKELELGWKTLLPFLKKCDALLLNKEEAAELADLPPRHLEDILKKIGDAIEGILIVTDGERGAYAVSDSVRYRVASLKGKRVNTTGAGDAFGSGLVSALIKKKDLDTALRVAALNAHGVITHMGAKAGILKRFPSANDLKRVSIKKW